MQRLGTPKETLPAVVTATLDATVTSVNPAEVTTMPPKRIPGITLLPGMTGTETTVVTTVRPLVAVEVDTKVVVDPRESRRTNRSVRLGTSPTDPL